MDARDYVREFRTLAVGFRSYLRRLEQSPNSNDWSESREFHQLTLRAGERLLAAFRSHFIENDRLTKLVLEFEARTKRIEAGGGSAFGGCHPNWVYESDIDCHVELGDIEPATPDWLWCDSVGGTRPNHDLSLIHI